MGELEDDTLFLVSYHLRGRNTSKVTGHINCINRFIL